MDPDLPPYLEPNGLPDVENLTPFVTYDNENPIHGSQSDVYEGTLRQGGREQQVAVKAFRCACRSDRGTFIIIQNRRISREARLWYTLKHPNLLPLLGLYGKPGRPLGLLSPYYHKGTINSFLSGHEARELVIPGLLIGIARGLRYLHEENIVHGDMKPSNVLVDDQGNAKICDFGISKLLGQAGYTTGLKATTRYMPPELAPDDVPLVDGEGDDDVTQEQPKNKKLDYPCDIYSLAMTILEVVSGKVPFFHVELDVHVWTRVGACRRPDFRRYSCDILTPRMQTLIGDCWCQEPNDRLNIVEVQSRLLEMFPTLPSQATDDSLV